MGFADSNRPEFRKQYTRDKTDKGAVIISLSEAAGIERRIQTRNQRLEVIRRKPRSTRPNAQLKQASMAARGNPRDFEMEAIFGSDPGIPQDDDGVNDISFVDEQRRDMPLVDEDFPQISDMVAIARILDATLVMPMLDKKSFWQDSSTFSDIFDESHFINSLQGDVTIIKELPTELESVPRIRKHLTSWGSMGYYEDLTRLWKEHQVIHVPKSDSRLANNGLPLDIQRLRCRALYNALRFSPPIENLAKKLVERLKSHGRYIALHLRYEKDMLSFTGCTYGLSQTEAEVLRRMRENTNHWKMKKINSTEQRLGGYCPLTPKEVGIFLQALGYRPSTWIYIAAGEIYGGDQRLSDLRSRFPNLVSKEMVSNPEELKMFANHASQTAALDYIVSVESDVFIPSYSGNMARAVEGHRRFLGHRKTITPDRQGLVELFDKLERGDLEEGSSLSSLVTKMHKHRQGAPRKRFGSLPGIKGRARFRTEESFYENPFPECICRTKVHDQSYQSSCLKEEAAQSILADWGVVGSSGGPTDLKRELMSEKETSKHEQALDGDKVDDRKAATKRDSDGLCLESPLLCLSCIVESRQLTSLKWGRLNLPKGDKCTLFLHFRAVLKNSSIELNRYKERKNYNVLFTKELTV
ncbi:O-fucosyltransferase 38 [Asimina triloba]